MPVIVVPVNANVPVMVVLPRFADAILEVTKVVELVKTNCPLAVNMPLESVRYGVPVTELLLLYTDK
jgi:hypothetical protein